MELVKPDFGLFFWMVVSFSILLFLLTKYAWNPIAKSLKEREESIEKALKAAEEAKKEYEKIKAENDKVLKEALLERNKIIKEAHDTKNKIIEEAKNQAKEEAAKILKNAQEEIEHEKNVMLAEIKSIVAEVSVSIAEKIIKKELATNEEQKKYIEQLFDNEVNLN